MFRSRARPKMVVPEKGYSHLLVQDTDTREFKQKVINVAPSEFHGRLRRSYYRSRPEIHMQHQCVANKCPSTQLHSIHCSPRGGCQDEVGRGGSGQGRGARHRWPGARGEGGWVRGSLRTSICQNGPVAGPKHHARPSLQRCCVIVLQDDFPPG